MSYEKEPEKTQADFSNPVNKVNRMNKQMIFTACLILTPYLASAATEPAATDKREVLKAAASPPPVVQGNSLVRRRADRPELM